VSSNGDWWSTLCNWCFCQVQSHATQKNRPIIKNPAEQIQILCHSLRIRGQLPAPIVNGGGDSFWKWPDFQLWKARDLDLDLGSRHTAYNRASLVDIYLYAKFNWNRKKYLWTDGHLRPALLGRNCRRIDQRTCRKHAKQFQLHKNSPAKQPTATHGTTVCDGNRESLSTNTRLYHL